ncbi:hypothetical protein G6F32_015627 [Rhizopus arrhizus]|nr:hypothetical protein G6F32_015627 [Rhizopus arrhizus]
MQYVRKAWPVAAGQARQQRGGDRGADASACGALPLCGQVATLKWNHASTSPPRSSPPRQAGEGRWTPVHGFRPFGQWPPPAAAGVPCRCCAPCRENAPGGQPGS